MCCRGVESEGQPWEAVDVHESMWCLEDDVDEAGETLKTLMISLIRPPPTDGEITWKKGKHASSDRQSADGHFLHINATETWISHAKVYLLCCC